MLRYEHGGDVYGQNTIKLDFSVNVNPLGMPEAAQRAVIDAMRSFSDYPDHECRALRRALSEKYSVDYNSILCGNGASDLIFRICAAMRPKKVLTLAPTFSEYERCASLFGAQMLEYRLKEENAFALSSDFLDMLSPDIDILFLCNPNNPTGRLINGALLDDILARCAESGIITVLDECFIGFTHARSMCERLSDHTSLLVLNAFTKLYGMAGLRLGYLMGSQDMLANIGRYGAEWSVSSVAQAAGIGALSDQTWQERTLTLIKAEKKYMEEALTSLGVTVYHSDTDYLLIKSNTPLHDALLEIGLMTRDCSNFTGLNDAFIRIALKTHRQNAVLVEGIGRALGRN